ncbi:conjugal transfer protein TrbN [Dyella marensis]|uniref:conjugal transfer protein TrbN n=1 Tax=Dyella marensis TaxID=500610 RepID=UPI00337986A2
MAMPADFAELPPRQHEMVVCAISAGLAYEVPVNLMLAVAEQEGGRPGQWIRNADGSYDVGALQFNTTYLRQLASYGITPDSVAAPGCFAYRLAAWRLRGHLRKDGGDLWTRAANYHSRTPRHNARYREQLMRRAWRWSQWLRRQFHTHSIDDIRPPSPPADHRIGQRGEANMAGVRNHGDHPAWP